jgi:hypothetical protein
MEPTVGRVLHYYENHPGLTEGFRMGPQLAFIAQVHSDTCVNIALFRHDGRPVTIPATSITLASDLGAAPREGCFCVWPPRW